MGGTSKGEHSSSAVHEAILRAVIESPRGVVIFALDRDYRYVAFNEAHRRTMQSIWNVEIAVGRSMLELIGRDDDRQRAKANFDRALSGEHLALVEEYGDDRYSRRYYENLYSPIEDAQGGVVGLTVFLTDITAQKRDQEELDAYRARLESLVEERTRELRHKEELYRSLVTNAPVSVIVHRAGTVVYANPSAAALARCPAGTELAGRTLASLFGDHAPREAPDGTPEAPALVREVTVRRPDGTRAEVEWRTIEVVFDDARASLSLVVDLSERKRAEAERRRLETKMLQTQKLESLGLLAGSIAHDFNNLLVGVLGNADLALRDSNLSEDTRALLARIKTTSIRATELTAQLLTYTGKTPLIVRPLDLSAIAAEMADLVRMSVPMNARLALSLEAGLPAFEGDGAQVRQIVMNLMTNAADAIGGAPGEIRVQTCLCTGEPEPTATTFGETMRGRSYVCLEVRDTGIGMDESTRSRIFDPFFSTKESGRGLGLAAVVGIVRAHGGAIRVTSEPGQGSTFRVFFPASDRVLRAEPEPKSSESWQGSGTIVIADDEPRVRQVLALMLREVGFDVLEASSMTECLDLFRANESAVRALLVDVTMPGGGGREIVRALRGEGKHVPVILSSGYPEEAVGVELGSDAHVSFLEKPFDFDALARVLQKALEGGRPAPT